MASKRLLSIKTVCKKLDCHRATITRLVNAGKLPKPMEIDGLGLRFWERDIDDYLDEVAANARKNAPGK